MSDKEPTYAIDEPLEPGLHYREETGHEVHTLPKRFCGLWLDGVDDPVSDIDVLSFRKRFGAVAVDAEGLGGVETLPEYRQQGYVRKVITKAMEGMAERVAVAFIPDGIESLYEKFGFVSCLADGYLTVPVRHVESQLGHLPKTASNYTLREHTSDDLPAMIDLYNVIHAHRPWTFERQASWNRIPKQQTWRPGSEVLVLEDAERLVGYAILKRYTFGQISRNFIVEELTAENMAAAQYLLAEISARCRQHYLSEFQVREPIDSIVGRIAQWLGCTYHQEYFATGGIMGLILNREQLLDQLAPELLRRLGNAEQTGHDAAFALLQQGEFIPDNSTLLRLLIGYWSLADAQINGMVIPKAYESVCRGWFPGGNTPSLPMPYSHYVDRY